MPMEPVLHSPVEIVEQPEPITGSPVPMGPFVDNSGLGIGGGVPSSSNRWGQLQMPWQVARLTDGSLTSS